MSVDSLKPSITSQAVHPGQDAHDDRQPEPRRKGPPRQSGKDDEDQVDPQPVLNHRGEVMGVTVNITA